MATIDAVVSSIYGAYNNDVSVEKRIIMQKWREKWLCGWGFNWIILLFGSVIDGLLLSDGNWLLTSAESNQVSVDV